VSLKYFAVIVICVITTPIVAGEPESVFIGHDESLLTSQLPESMLRSNKGESTELMDNADLISLPTLMVDGGRFASVIIIIRG
jgi:hypothetical protein